MKPRLTSSSSSTPRLASRLLGLALPLAACDVEPRTALEDPRTELDDDALDDDVLGDDALEPGADALAAAADPAAITPGFPVEIEIVGNDVVLTWSQVGAATTYGVMTGLGVFYSPGPVPGNYYAGLGVVSGSGPQYQFVHTGAGTSAATFIYRVAALGPTGASPGVSSTVVKLAQPLVAGANLVSMPLVDGSVYDAESLHEALGGFAGPLGQLTRWDASTQGFEDWNPWSGQPGFDIAPGEALFVHTHGPAILVMVGHAPAEDGEVVHQIVPGWNLVAAPMDLSPPSNPYMIHTASTVAPLMAAVQQLAEWNAATQSYVTYQHPSGWGTNFVVEANQPIWVQAAFPSIWD